jgi:hypothetical protein
MNQLLEITRSKTLLALVLYLLVVASVATFVYVEVQILQLAGNSVPLKIPMDLQ